MNKILNTFYKNHSLIYKAILYVITVAVITYFFPKSGKFKYDFDRGKPWHSENLYAPFDFAIKKSEEEIQDEKSTIQNQAVHYFDVDLSVFNTVKSSLENEFNNTFQNDIYEPVKPIYKKAAYSILDLLYTNGILQNEVPLNPKQAVVILDNNIQVNRTTYDALLVQSEVSSIIEKTIQNSGLDSISNQFKGLFFKIIEPNLTYNKAFTEQAINDAINTISYTRGIVEKETLIIAKGEIVRGDKFQILKSLESEYESQVLNSSGSYWVLFAYTLLVALALLMLMLFIRKYRIEVFENNTKLTFVFFNIVLMVLITMLVVKYNSEYVYVVPICILPLMLKAFFDARLGLFTHVITVLLLGFIVPNSYEYMFLQIIAGIVTILTVSELYKRANLFISVGQITFVYIVAYFAFFVIHEGSVANLKWETFGLFFLGGLATLFVQPLIYVFEKMFGLVSDVSLLELSDTNSKLLKMLSNKAPGSFHHSLNVANLAEACANEIGANAMLTRVGALYHDIGKMQNPTYFTENQVTGLNPHDELPPSESAKIIINHVIHGVEMAKRHNLPERVIDFIRTHHGTSRVYYFYMQELKNNEANMVEDNFHYKGPAPFSKETAILMMCDSVEAASKSIKEPNTIKINNFVETIIDKQIEEDQFLNANITFKEIQSIKKILKKKLANIYHLRIEYPD